MECVKMSIFEYLCVGVGVVSMKLSSHVTHGEKK